MDLLSDTDTVELLLLHIAVVVSSSARLVAESATVSTRPVLIIRVKNNTRFIHRVLY
jgi:hypothetical protein